MNDKELYKKCKIYGSQALQARNKFIGLLPEVFKRRLYVKKGYGSIYEFAAKLAGVSHEQVNKVLNLEKRFEDKPTLHAALVEGKISINKLLRIAPIVTNENERELAKKVEILSSRALEVFVSEMKSAGVAKNDNNNGFLKPLFCVSGVHVRKEKNNDYDKSLFEGHYEQVSKEKNTDFDESIFEDSAAYVRNDNGFDKPLFNVPKVHVHSRNLNKAHQQANLKLDPEVEQELLQLQEKGIDINQLLRQFLHERKENIERKKLELSKKQTQERQERAVIGKPAKRYMPAEIRHVVKEEFGTKCAEEGCWREAQNLHHEKSFSKYQSHDPRFLKPLCKAHHELVHIADEKVQKFRWALNVT